MSDHSTFNTIANRKAGERVSKRSVVWLTGAAIAGLLATIVVTDTEAACGPGFYSEDGKCRQQVGSCGWYAVFECSKSGNPGGPGHTIFTSEYPNFRPGWYCKVMGPSSKAVANSNANKYGGYAKSAC